MREFTQKKLTAATDEQLALDNQLCFMIYSASREMTKLYRPLLEKLDLTYPQYLTLLVLWEQNGITVKELGQRLYLDSGTLTPLLKRMETQSLLNRQRDPADERKVIITLTMRGQSLKEEARCIPSELYSHAGQSADVLERLFADMKELLAHLHQANLRQD
ncbi:MarR family transcriptional regulator [Paenibacillus sp. UMB4589-SE434]|uniref:MarR family winged helix-turn-helix transcriptional regulator n=1 Tax=Paenibacillus sp. UMB4589-SE434 TaxID=3046314 RepID=UPI00254C6F3D|nr:MarR family transcriptional regulator [Paenibacillus sp. UMB4589-SE434]MDK8181921.1 MarR family transcriptional regulator [Paenibacillus sp. UMB4589-SE434]